MNANDYLRHYTSSNGYHRYSFGLLLTDGAKALADHFKCYWFLDLIASYQFKLKSEPFQVWRLKKLEDDSAIVTCDDGNGNTLAQQAVDHTDFKPYTATLWVEDGVTLLPSEH